MTLKHWLKGYPEKFQLDGFYNSFGHYLQYENKPYFSLAFVRIFCIIGTIVPLSVLVYAFFL
jgi:hypothetical protein